MKNNIKYLIIIFLTFSSCEKENKNKIQISNSDVSLKLPKKITADSYNPKSICECNTDGTQVLNQLLKKRKKFKNMNELGKNANASEYVKLLQKNWDTIRWECLKTFGTGMFTPSQCNDPDNIQSIKDTLLKLDIKT